MCVTKKLNPPFKEFGRYPVYRHFLETGKQPNPLIKSFLDALASLAFKLRVSDSFSDLQLYYTFFIILLEGHKTYSAYLATI